MLFLVSRKSKSEMAASRFASLSKEMKYYSVTNDKDSETAS